MRALEAEKAELQRVHEKATSCSHEEAESSAVAPTAAAFEEAERKIKREMPPGGSRMDTLPRLFEEDLASRMKIDLDAEGSQIRKGSSQAPLLRPKGKRKTPKRSQRPAKKHPHNSDLSHRSGGDA